MLISDLTVECYRAPLRNPIRNGRYEYATSDRCLIRIATDEGVTGIGIGDGGVGLAAAAEMIAGTVASLRPHLLGENPLASERLWDRMWSPKLLGRRGFTTRVISAVDIAVWDLRAKALGVSVATLLGGYREAMPAYVAGGYYEPDKSEHELAREMAEYVEMGARAVKMKLGGVPRDIDLRRVGAVRSALGDDVKLLVDANNSYRTFEAIEMCKRLEEFDVYWLEEPVMPDNYRGLRRISEATTIPTASGENEYTRYGFRDLIEQGTPSILNPDAQFVGGVTEFMKVAAMAQAYDLPIAPHGCHDIHVHLASAIPNGLMIEFSPPARDPLVGAMQADPMRLVGGEVRVPDGVGFGLILDEDALARYRVM